MFFTGRLNFTALSEYEHDKIALIDEINRVIKPARPATLESTYIGVLLAASNQVNAQAAALPARNCCNWREARY